MPVKIGDPKDTSWDQPYLVLNASDMFRGMEDKVKIIMYADNIFI